MKKKGKVKKVMSNDKAFIGIRVPDTQKAKLEKKAETDGISLQQLCTRLLDLGHMKENLNTVDVLNNVQEDASDWEAVVDEVSRLNGKRDQLEEMIEEKSGLFTSAPQSLRNALRACNFRIEIASNKLEKMFPQEKRKTTADILLGG